MSPYQLVLNVLRIGAGDLRVLSMAAVYAAVPMAAALMNSNSADRFRLTVQTMHEKSQA